MAISYILITQNAPLVKEGVQDEVTYARTVSSHKATTEELAQNISRRCTVNPVDVVAVLHALGDELKNRITQGEIVELNGIGTFRVIGGTGVLDNPKKVRNGDFIRRKINFHPDSSLKATLSTLSFTRKKTD